MGKTGNPTPQFFIMKNSHHLQPCPEHVYPFLEGNILVGICMASFQGPIDMQM
jgi:hypothetical protein